MTQSLFSNYVTPGIIVGSVYALYTGDIPRGIGRAIGTSLIAGGIGIVAGPTIGYYAGLALPAIEFLSNVGERVELMERMRATAERAEAQTRAVVNHAMAEANARMEAIQAAFRRNTPAA